MRWHVAYLRQYGKEIPRDMLKRSETFTVTYVCSNSLAFSEKRKNGF